jgi:hypothetical protein
MMNDLLFSPTVGLPLVPHTNLLPDGARPTARAYRASREGTADGVARSLPAIPQTVLSRSGSFTVGGFVPAYYSHAPAGSGPSLPATFSVPASDCTPGAGTFHEHNGSSMTQRPLMAMAGHAGTCQRATVGRGVSSQVADSPQGGPVIAGTRHTGCFHPLRGRVGTGCQR